jgi:hypothetical protein
MFPFNVRLFFLSFGFATNLQVVTPTVDDTAGEGRAQMGDSAGIPDFGEFVISCGEGA